MLFIMVTHIFFKKLPLKPFLGVHLVTLIIFTILCDHHHYLFRKLFHHPKQTLNICVCLYHSYPLYCRETLVCLAITNGT